MRRRFRKRCEKNNRCSSNKHSRYLRKQSIEYFKADIEAQLYELESKVKLEDIYKVDKFNKKTDNRKGAYEAYKTLAYEAKLGVMDALEKGDLKEAVRHAYFFGIWNKNIENLPKLIRELSGYQDLDRQTKGGIIRGKELVKLTPRKVEEIREDMLEEYKLTKHPQYEKDIVPATAMKFQVSKSVIKHCNKLKAKSLKAEAERRAQAVIKET